MRLFWLIVWILFVGYAIWLAPGVRGWDDPLLSGLLTMTEEEPALVALFSLFGVYWAVFACLLLQKDRGSWPAWPFVLLAMFVGAFALLPYLFLSLPNRRVTSRTPAGLTRLLHSRLLHAGLLLLTLWLYYYALVQGNPEAIGEAFRASHFVHVMVIDFIILAFVAAVVIHRRQQDTGKSGLASVLAFLPLPVVGPLVYLLFVRKRWTGL